MSYLTTAASIATAIMAGAIAATPICAQTRAIGEATSVSVLDPVAFGGTPALDESDLGQVTGREDVGAIVASATQRNTVSNNSVSGTSTTGNVQIVGNAFQNLQGLAVISANSGNNVAINAAMNVTVNLAPR